MSAAWVSEPYAGVARQVFPWSFGIVVALPAIVVCLMVPGPHWRRMRQMGSAAALRAWW